MKFETRHVEVATSAFISTALSLGLAFLFTMMPISFSHAEETTAEKAEVIKDKAVNSTKRGYRSVKDKTCEMVNGKMECVAKKVSNKVKNAADEAEAKASEIKNKVD